MALRVLQVIPVTSGPVWMVFQDPENREDRSTKPVLAFGLVEDSSRGSQWVEALIAGDCGLLEPVSAIKPSWNIGLASDPQGNQFL